jgi:hypothetical protein
MDHLDKRETHRTALNEDGIVVYDNTRFAIRTRDISLGGSRIETEAQPTPPENASVKVCLSKLGIRADGVVRWVRQCDDGPTVLGLQFHAIDFRPDAA